MLRALIGAACVVAATQALAFDAADLARLDGTGKCVKCDLRGADLRETKLREADLKGVDLSGAKGLTQARLDTACGDDRTVLPKKLTIRKCR